MVLLQHTNLEQALTVARKIQKSVEQGALKHEYTVREEKVITDSVRVASAIIKTKEDINQLFEQADKALYKAKENGRNTVYSL